jgi:hypothetical protein
VEAFQVLDDVTPLPFDGPGLLMALTLDGYFDESYRQDGSEPLSIGGYIFKASSYTSFCRAWKRMLKAGPAPTTHFHMTNLYARDYEYKGWSVEDRANVFKLAIAAVREHMYCGVSVLFSQAEFEQLAPPLYRFEFGSMYATACQMVLRATATWMEDHRCFLPIAYAFERGHEFWDEANVILGGIGTLPDQKRLYRYRTHFDLDKTESYGLQAADMLSWIMTRLDVGIPDNHTMRAFGPIILSLVEGQSHRYQMLHLKTEGLIRYFNDQAARRDEDRFLVSFEKARKLRLR